MKEHTHKRRSARRVHWRGRRFVVCLALLLVTTTVVAQQFYRGFRGPVHTGVPPQHNGGFMFCRLKYDSNRREPGGQGWTTDYPNADNNYMLRLSQLTEAKVSRWDDQTMGFTTVSALDPLMFDCPFLFASDVGTATFDEQESKNLRAYLLKGGFLWADDFWGEAAWQQWLGELQLIVPEYRMIDIGPGHPLFSIFYQVPEVPQIPSIQHWLRSGGATSERGAESATPDLRAVVDETGRILVLMSHDTDIADGWEREAENVDFFYKFTARAYGVGINVAVWAMSH